LRPSGISWGASTRRRNRLTAWPFYWLRAKATMDGSVKGTHMPWDDSRRSSQPRRVYAVLSVECRGKRSEVIDWVTSLRDEMSRLGLQSVGLYALDSDSSSHLQGMVALSLSPSFKGTTEIRAMRRALTNLTSCWGGSQIEVAPWKLQWVSEPMRQQES